MNKFNTATDIVPSVSIMFLAFDRNWPKITSFKNEFTFIKGIWFMKLKLRVRDNKPTYMERYFRDTYL